MSHVAIQDQVECLCGAVKLNVSYGAKEFGTCHCSMCRKWSGGTFLAVECKSATAVDERQLGVYGSSEWGERCFCKACGSTLLWRAIDGSHNAVSLQAFKDPSSFKFVSQIFIDEKPSSYSFSEATHNMTGEEFIAMITSAEQKHD